MLMSVWSAVYSCYCKIKAPAEYMMAKTHELRLLMLLMFIFLLNRGCDDYFLMTIMMPMTMMMEMILVALLDVAASDASSSSRSNIK